MNWTELDWAALDRLRAGFLASAPGTEPYWQSESAIASYDLTYGERIGWKWDQVLRELAGRCWNPVAGGAALIVDWGCGSGVASRRAVSHFGANRFRELVLADHSSLATEYSAARAAESFPGLAVSQATASFLEGDDAIDLLVLSHVLNELDESSVASVRRLVLRSRAVIWVEAGTSPASRELGRIRDSLLADFTVIAPCTHQRGCPMFDPGNERHWCHFFAPPPPGVFADRDWVKFGQRAGIDLRSLPYSFVALERNGCPGPAGRSRIVGRPEQFKPYTRFLNCDARGLAMIDLPKRTAPGLYKTLDRTNEPLVLKWEGETPALDSRICD